MTTLDLPPPARARRAPSPFAIRLAVVLACIVAAYHYSLLTLARSLALDTPLAYIGLVPLMSLGLALVRARPRPGEPDIHDREVDVIVGVPLVAAAVLLITLLPARLSSLFWVYRIDLLSLPLFVAGVVALAFGVRALWRLRLAVAFLLLAWPLPYTLLLNRWLDPFTSGTIRALRAALGVWHVGRPLAGGDGSLFQVTHAGRGFTLSVASSCSGVNGMVGFLLVGVAFAAVVRGRRLPKLLWLAGGLTVVWVLNVVRLLLIFAAGERFGEHVAIDGLHPVIGLVLFCAGVTAMVLAMPLFGLSVAPRVPRTAATRHRLAVPRLRGVVAVLVAGALVVGVANAGLRQYQLVAGDLGDARLESFAQRAAVVPGTTPVVVATYPWARRFFGSSSTWTRYSYAPVTVDVVATDDLGRFDAYGLEACYRFHGYQVRAERSFALGGGVTGRMLTYTNTKTRSTWSVVYWLWPVRAASGHRFERVVLLLPGHAGTGTFAGPAPRTDPVRELGLHTFNLSTGGTDAGLDQRTRQGRTYLLGFARAMVAGRAA